MPMKLGLLGGGLKIPVVDIPANFATVVVGHRPGLMVYEAATLGGLSGLASMWTPWFEIPTSGGGEDPFFQHLDLSGVRANISFKKSVIASGYTELTFQVKTFDVKSKTYQDGPHFTAGISGCKGLLVGDVDFSVLFKVAFSNAALSIKENWEKAYPGNVPSSG